MNIHDARPLTDADMRGLEHYANSVFKSVGIDVAFSGHFLKRVNDERNIKQITLGELGRLFKLEAEQWGRPISKMGDQAQAVLKDLKTDINLPFVLRYNKRHRTFVLIGKSVMRKEKFKTNNKVYAVEATAPDREILVPGYGTMTMKTLELSISRSIKELADSVQFSDGGFHPFQFRGFNNTLMQKTSVIQHKLSALIDAYDDLANQNKYKNEFGENIVHTVDSLSEQYNKFRSQ